MHHSFFQMVFLIASYLILIVSVYLHYSHAPTSLLDFTICFLIGLPTFIWHIKHLLSKLNG